MKNTVPANWIIITYNDNNNNNNNNNNNIINIISISNNNYNINNRVFPFRCFPLPRVWLGVRVRIMVRLRVTG